MNRSITKRVLVNIGLLVTLVAGVFLAVPASAQDATPEATMIATGEAPYTAAEVKQAAALDKARGHLLAAVELWKAKSYIVSAAHAGHAQSEVYSVRDDLKAKNADTAILAALDKFASVIGQDGDVKEVEAVQQAALDALNTASETLLGDLRNDAQFKGSVIQSLVGAAEHEYEESLKDGKIVQATEYQDATAFIMVAEGLWKEILSVITVADATETNKIDEQFAALKVAFPDFVKAPEQAAAYADVEKAVDEIKEQIGKLLALPELAGDSVEAAIDGIKDAVADALKEYKEGNADEAYEKAANAYLEGFEYLEGDLLKQDKELVSTLELQFKDLRDGIKAGKPIADLETLTNAINENLEKAEALLEMHQAN